MNENGLAIFNTITDLSDETILSSLDAEGVRTVHNHSFLRAALIAAAFALILIGGLFLAGNSFNWFAEVAADEAEEQLISGGHSVLRYNTNLPDGYEVHLRSEYVTPDYDPTDLKQYERTDYRSPDYPPVPELQIVNSEGERVLFLDFTTKDATNRFLSDIHFENRGVTLYTKDGRDQNGNRFLWIGQKNYFPLEYYPEGKPLGVPDEEYFFLVDIAESKFTAIVITAYCSEEEASRLFEALSIRLEYDEPLPSEPSVREDFLREMEEGEYEIHW